MIPSRPNGVLIDVDAILHRHPEVCVIDALAHNNPQGSREPTRWEDVQDLLNAGIRVIAMLNIDSIKELQDRIQTITDPIPITESGGTAVQLPTMVGDAVEVRLPWKTLKEKPP